jgi:hypothetical protein
MSVLTSEAVVLRTWPVHESDLLVSFFTRDYGRLKGMAKAALKSRKRFGGALEPMTVARAWFAERPRQELVRLDQLEILRSPLSAPVDQARMAVLSFYAEVIDEALPERDPQDDGVPAAGQCAGADERREGGDGAAPILRTPILRTVDGADVFLAVDDAPDGPAAGHRSLHGVRRGAWHGRGALQRVCRRIVLRAACKVPMREICLCPLPKPHRV